jgi:hypothetical protein
VDRVVVDVEEISSHDNAMLAKGEKFRGSNFVGGNGPGAGNANRGRPTAAQREEEIPPSKIRYGQDSLLGSRAQFTLSSVLGQGRTSSAGFATRNFSRRTYLSGMPKVAFEPCIPARGTKVPSGLTGSMRSNKTATA